MKSLKRNLTRQRQVQKPRREGTEHVGKPEGRTVCLEKREGQGEGHEIQGHVDYSKGFTCHPKSNGKYQ